MSIKNYSDKGLFFGFSDYACDELLKLNLKRVGYDDFEFHFFGHYYKNLVSVGIREGVCFLLGDNVDIISDLKNFNFENNNRFMYTGLNNGNNKFYGDKSARCINLEYSNDLLTKIKLQFSNIKEKAITEKNDLASLIIRNMVNNEYPSYDLYGRLDQEKKKQVFDIVADKINNQSIFLNSPDVCDPAEIHILSQIKLDQILVDIGFKDYGFVDITRSSNASISEGNYAYQIDEDNQLMLFKNPLKLLVDKFGWTYFIFDKNLYESSKENFRIISESQIRDFQLFGSELMINNVETFDVKKLYGTIDSPKLLGTGFSELLFGQSYTILKGMSSMAQQLNKTIKESKINIRTISEIKDTRVVQLIFDDKSDIEFKGMMIYYDFNRKMGNIKNKEKIELDKQSSSKENGQDNISKLKEYKKMLEEELIDEEEFKELKRKLLQL